METIKLKAVGNLHLEDIEDPFYLINNGIEKTDILFGNLELSFSRYKRSTQSNRKRIKSDIELVNELLVEGFRSIFVNLANDYSHDCNFKRWADIISLLKKLKIGYCGIGENLDESRKPYIRIINGKIIGFLDYAWNFNGARYATETSFGVAPLNKQLIFEDIKNLKSQTDYIVISLHWGYEDELYPMPSQRKLAQDLINRGANLVLGHHPNLVQGIEEYNGGLIAYSLGNFVHRNSDDSAIENDSRSIILDCEFWGDQIVWDVIPVEISEDGRPRAVLDTEFKRYVKEDLSKWFGMANYGFCWNEFRLRKDLGDEMREKINENI